MAYIEKVSGSSWRIRKSFNGKRYDLLLNYRPSKKEADILISNYIGSDAKNPPSRVSFSTAAADLDKNSSNTLRSTTLRGYSVILRSLPSWFTNLQLRDITANDAQRLANEIAASQSAKTCKNKMRYVTRVMHHYRPDLNLQLSLPRVQKPNYHVPTREEVDKLMDLLSGTDYYIPVWISMYGLRLSEICALTLDDILDGEIIVNKVKIRSSSGWIVEHNTKNNNSARIVPCSVELTDFIKRSGTIYNGAPSSITNYMQSIQKRYGLPVFSIHMMRHFFASTLVSSDVNMYYANKFGGWSPKSKVLEGVYAEMQDEKKKKEADKIISALK